MDRMDQMIDQAYSDLKGMCGGVRNDYFGLIYIEKEFRLPREQAISQTTFGGNDYGFDGFHFDRDRRNLYLFQFKNSESHAQFKQSFQRLIDIGMEQIFDASSQDQHLNQILLQLKSCLIENQALVERVCIHFVFKGDPAEAEQSQVLDKLREDLENKKYLIDQFFGRSVTMVIEFRAAHNKKVGAATHQHITHTYPLDLIETLAKSGSTGQLMHIGLIRLVDLHAMYRDMGQRFFERNIRAALPEDESVNRSLSQAFKRIVLDAADDASNFIFNHNGVSIAAEKLENIDNQFKITEPRLLNGAQTVTTFARFIEKNKDNKQLKEQKKKIEDLRVICKIITEAKPEFVITVTINNNRQNPVEPWNLHANDMIQLELQDKFREDLGIYYERQENAFVNLSDEDLEDAGISQHKAIELLRLSQTFLVSDGEISNLSNMRKVFEDEKLYSQVFHPSRLKADSRKIVLCYKIQFRIRKLMNEIFEKGPSKYGYISRSRNLLWALLCQGILNDDDLENYLEELGKTLVLEADFTEWLARLATTRCRFLISSLVDDKAYKEKVADGNFSFLRTNAAYKKCMEYAYKRWRWVEKKLK